MLVNALEKEETRIAIVRDGRLDDFHIERSSHETRVGSIYKGRVENVHPSLQAAFVSIGLQKNAFLHVSEVHGPGEDKYAPRRGPRPKRLIQNLLRSGQEVMVQVIRDEFGEKGPSVTMEIGLPGRFLVLTPLSKHIGISKKIESTSARAQLRQQIREMIRGWAEDIGFIVRTSSGDTPFADLRADLEYLLRVWRSVESRAAQARSPAMLYQEPDIVLRTVRDVFSKDIDDVIVDDRGVHQRLIDFFDAVMPCYRERVRMYGGTTPLFHKFGIESQIDQLNQRSVDLPSGGSIVIEQTEALTAIDVNSGRLVREANPEDLALRTNLEAGREVMRQLRLRDIGGIIVVDFIDMRMERHRRQVEHALREEAGRDRSQMVILPMSQFCLVQIAREKVRPSVVSVSHDPCPSCGGTGHVKSVETLGLEVMRELKSTLERPDIAVVDVTVAPDLASNLEQKITGFKGGEVKEVTRERTNLAQRTSIVWGDKLIHILWGKDQPLNRAEFTCYNATGEKVVDFVR
ncbi:MAG: Rne/Rng family ribonuclease [Planctomycetes bacterium]|nr:Rne/Rng family ribonuclease [Planctomycetota bacterium]